MNKYELIDRILSRKWSQERIRRYIGDFSASCIAYSSDPAMRENAASGGVTSTILSWLLQTDEIDGALVCTTEITDGSLVVSHVIAENQSEIIDAQGSKYQKSDFFQSAIPMIRDFEGKVAVVGLPCQLTFLKQQMESDPDLKEKIVCTIALFCGHNNEPELIAQTLRKLEKQAGGSRIKRFVFRKGSWRGKLEAEFENGAVINAPASRYTLYHNLFFFAEKKCLSCYDHFGYNADFCIGDAWLMQMKQKKHKHNAIIAKNEKAAKILDRMTKAEKLILEWKDIQFILEAQSRSIRLHYNVTSRRKAGRIFGLNIHDRVNIRTNPIEDILAFFLMFNWVWSNGRFSRYVLKVPRQIMKLYLYFIKALEIV